MSGDDLAARKRLLIARSELARTELALALTDIRGAIAPPPVVRSARSRRIAAFLVGSTVPILGISRIGKVLRAISFVFSVARVVSGLRRR
jgi:hypothetical protein